MSTDEVGNNLHFFYIESPNLTFNTHCAETVFFGENTSQCEYCKDVSAYDY